MIRSSRILVLATGLCAAVVSAFGGLAEETSYALGGVGAAGTMSRGERELRAVLEEPDAVARLEAMLPGASDAGQLYILLGLHVKDAAAFQRALKKIERRETEVETMGGCMIMRQPFRALVAEIEQGKDDAALKRPAW